MEKVFKTEDEWRRSLSPEQYRITRRKGTERAFTGQYLDTHEKGIYKCVCCGNELFSSDAKFDSGSGWPSFYAPISDRNIITKTDRELLWETRTEVICACCDAHLGHVFDDGPEPTRKRYCLNSSAMLFEKK